MDSSASPLAQYIENTLPPLADHAAALRALGDVIAANRLDVVSQLRAILDQTRPLLDRLRTVSSVEQLTTVLLDGLGSSSLTTFRPYLEQVVDWSERLHAAGISYGDQVQLVAAARRALLPTLLRNYSAGPEAVVVFTTLDSWEHAVLGIMAVAGIEVSHRQLTQGAHQRTVGRLTGGVAHALNNTMAVIVGRAQILEEQVAEESVRQELREIQKIARGSADSVKRLQQYAAERQTTEPTRIDVNALVNDVIQLTRFRWGDDAEASGIRIDIARDLGNVPPVIGQPAHLRDALVELILNSVEAMPLGGQVTVRTQRSEERVEILVGDQGEGMDTATRARASEPFFTTKTAGHIGLGLATAVVIVRGMGGTLTLESQAGRGTVAIISLPAAEEIRQAMDLRPSRLARWASILVVDDEPMVRDVAARTLQLRGFRTVAADSGEDAVRVFTDQGPFQVVLVDLGMPGMNGFDTTRAIKDLAPRTIVILMTGWAAELDAKKMREAGIDRAITKPFDADQVLQLITEALAFQNQR